MTGDDLMARMVSLPEGLSRRHHFLGSIKDVTPEMLAEVDFDDRSTRRALILTVIIVCMTFIVVFVTTRLLVRRLMTRQFFLDDTLITIASLFTLGLCIVSLLALHVGFGQHVWAIPLPTVLTEIKSCVQLMFMANIFYTTAITFTKLSIIASYLRIFPYRTLRVLMYVTAAVTLGLFIASVPATIFQCSPISAAWDFDLVDGEDKHPKCYTFVKFLYATTGVNVVSDLVLCCAPLPYFWRLQMARRQKVIVSGLFFIGGFACVASITRLTYLHLIQTSIDVTWNLAPSVLWTIAECTIGIVCVSVPPMRPLFGRFLPDVFLTRRISGLSAGGGGGGGGAGGTGGRREAYAMGGWSETKVASASEQGGGVGDVEKALGERSEPAAELEMRKVAGSEAGDSVGGEETVPRSFLGDEEGRGLCIATVTDVKIPERVLQKG